MANKISNSQGKRLLSLARETIGYRLGAVSEVNQEGLEEDIFKQQLGTFVTLKIDNQLRGCIGNLEPEGTVIESVGRNALNSAFHDHRFSALDVNEFEQVEINISVLTEAKQLHYLDGDDLLRKLQPGTDGVILRHKRSGATFLPQVWSQLPEPEMFLTHLCIKAGLSGRDWCDLHPEIYVYQVEYFEEGGC